MRNTQTFLSFIFATSFCLSAMADDSTNQIASTWTPPKNTEPMKVLAEAREDIAAGKYTNALEKFVWFQQDTAKADPLAFALSDWTNLGAIYPPALEKLKAIRDESEQKLRNKKGSFDAFDDFQAINTILGEENKTKDFFIWLDSNRPVLAKYVFDVVEPVLINAKEFSLCGKYINGETSYAEYLKWYRSNMQLAKEPKFGKRLQEFAEKTFINKTTTLIALLVVNDRKTEAQQVVDKISKESDVPEFKAEIQKALNGEIPPRWP
jgi:hypothetical protein